MPAGRAHAFVKVSIAVLAMIATGKASAPVLPPPAPETTIRPAPGAPVPKGPGEPAGDDSHDVLTRGPIHEAFAEQYNSDPAEGLVIAKAPPEPIDEVPPETMPEGNNIQWVPGYWGWDDERSDFIWISGLWRDIPPGQRWVPGYWNQADAGYQWVSGFWTGTESAELDYRPQPPASLEQGPNIAAPTEDQFWVPGVWTYVDTDYRWRPGYWAPAYDDWVWVPDRWVWTPYGFVFCAGYYDYRLPVRAVAFAPVYFSHVHWWHYHRRPYCPSVVLDCGPLTMHWFVRPNYCHYYFGDYYADTYYTGWGLQPWYTCSFGFGGYGGWRNRHCHYDPLFVHYSGYHRRHHNVDFGDRMHRWHGHYMAHADDRPRWTKRDQDNFDDMMRKANRQRGDGQQARIGRDFNDFVANPSERDQKFVKLDGRQRDRHTKTAKETVQLASMRHDLETEGGKIRGTRGDGKGRGGDASVALPGAGDDNNKGGDRGRQSRKLKLPTDQGAGDQAIVTQDGKREPNRHSKRANTPDGPPGGNTGIVGNDGGKGNNGGRNGRRGGGSELTDNGSGQDGNSKPGSGNEGRGRGNNNDNGRGGRGSKNEPAIDSPPGSGGGDGQPSGNGGPSNGNGSSRDRNRGKGGNNGNQNANPLDGNPSGGGSGNNNGSGSNRNRTPRRGNSGGGNSGFNGGSSDSQVQPLPGQGGGNSGGNGSGSGRSRSRGGSGSSDSNSNGGNSGGSVGGSSGGGNNSQRRGGSNRGNDGQGSGSTESGNGKKPNSGSFGPGGSGGSRGRNPGNSGGGGGGGSGNGKKKKD